MTTLELNICTHDVKMNRNKLLNDSMNMRDLFEAIHHSTYYCVTDTVLPFTVAPVLPLPTGL
jgi:hypothetical protein